MMMMMNSKRFTGKWQRPGRGTIPVFAVKDTRNLSYGEWCAGRDSNRAPPDYKPTASPLPAQLKIVRVTQLVKVDVQQNFKTGQQNT
jgi:hypothetical protein